MFNTPFGWRDNVALKPAGNKRFGSGCRWCDRMTQGLLCIAALQSQQSPPAATPAMLRC
jgi:hypothetical protein